MFEIGFDKNTIVFEGLDAMLYALNIHGTRVVVSYI
jgi:hypothetical protein